MSHSLLVVWLVALAALSIAAARASFLFEDDD
jgi:hypothetical protein